MNFNIFFSVIRCSDDVFNVFSVGVIFNFNCFGFFGSHSSLHLFGLFVFFSSGYFCNFCS